MVIFNKGKMKPTLILPFILLALVSCEIDNYDAPNLTISGKIIDVETEELVESGGVNSGTVVRFYEGNSTQPLIYNTKPDGTFTHSKIFPGTYSYIAEGPFLLAEEGLQNIEIKTDEEIEIKVIPNVRVNITLEEKTETTVNIKLSYEKMTDEQELVDVSIIWSEFQNPNVYTFSGGSIVTVEGNSLDPVSGERIFTIDGLQPNTPYYFRGSARTNNPGNYYNYSHQLEVQVP